MSNIDFIRSELDKFFPNQYKLDEGFDLDLIESGKHALQVRDEKNRAPREQVKRYAEQMKHSKFPPIIVTKDGKLVDGNTRWGGCKLNKVTVFPAFILNVDYDKAGSKDQAKVNALGATMNAVNGNPMSGIEIRRAIRNFLELNFTSEKIAKHLGVSTNVISSVRRQIEGETKLAKVGIKWDDHTGYEADSVRRALGHTEIVGLNDEPFKHLANLVLAAALTGPEITALGKEARAAGSDEAAVAILDKFRRDNSVRIQTVRLTGNGQPTQSAAFRKILASVTKHAGSEHVLLEADQGLVQDYLTEITTAIEVLLQLEKIQGA